MTLKIVDPLTGEVVPRGERGEICVKGPTLMLGYIGTPLDETLDAEGFFRTGDGGYLDDVGRLFWEGRLTDIIKTGGANVSPREVDEALVEASRRQGRRRPSACRTRRSARSSSPASCRTTARALDAEEIRRFLAGTAGQLQGAARRCCSSATDEIALTGNAKIKSAELRELAAERLSTA